MDKFAALIPLTVIMLGIDYIYGWPAVDFVLSYLRQIGF